MGWIYRHSLSLALSVLGVLICGFSLMLGEGQWFDLVSQTGGAFLTAGLINLLAGPLKETNKPEE